MKIDAVTGYLTAKKIWLGVKMIFEFTQIGVKLHSCAPFALNLSRKQRATLVAAALNFI